MDSQSECPHCKSEYWHTSKHPASKGSLRYSCGTLYDPVHKTSKRKPDCYIYEIRQLKEKHCEAWALIIDGKISPHEEECGLGKIHGLTLHEAEGILSDLHKTLQSTPINPPPDATCVIFKITDVVYEKGQWGSYGECEFEPYWDYTITPVEYES